MRRAAAALFFALAFAAPARASVPAEIAWEDLSNRDLSPEGKAALAADPGPWHHAESAHFIYHYVDPKAAETVLVHSEETYEWIKKLFGVSDDAWSRKVHVFVFEKKDAWQRFTERTGPGIHPDAFTTGWELFQYRDPFWLAPQHTLAHELTHVVSFRFLDGPIPLFLNEGLAEYVATRAAARQADGDDYAVRSFAPIPESEFIALAELSSFKTYPSEERVRTFYVESERFIRYLVLERKGDFYGFLKDVSRGAVWHAATERHYGAGASEISEGFRAYATTGKSKKGV